MHVSLLDSLPPTRKGGLARIRALMGAGGPKVVVIDDDPTGTQTVHGVDILADWSVASLCAALADPRPCFYRPGEHAQHAGGGGRGARAPDRLQPGGGGRGRRRGGRRHQPGRLDPPGAFCRGAGGDRGGTWPAHGRESGHPRLLRGRPLHARQRPLRGRRGHASCPRPRPSSRGTRPSGTALRLTRLDRGEDRRRRSPRATVASIGIGELRAPGGAGLVPPEAPRASAGRVPGRERRRLRRPGGVRRRASCRRRPWAGASCCGRRRALSGCARESSRGRS